MTPEQRLDRIRRASQALEEFVEPFFNEIEREYVDQIVTVSASSNPRATEINERLANGISVSRRLRAKFAAFIADGAVLESQRERAGQFDGMSASDLRLIDMTAR